MKKSVRKKAPSPPSNPGILREVSEEKEDNASKPENPPRRKYSSDESSEEEDVRELEGNVYTKAGMEVKEKLEELFHFWFYYSPDKNHLGLIIIADFEEKRRKCETQQSGNWGGSGEGGRVRLHE